MFLQIPSETLQIGHRLFRQFFVDKGNSDEKWKAVSGFWGRELQVRR